MRSSRLWVELIMLTAGVAFGLGLALAALGVVGLAFAEINMAQAADLPGQKTYEGMITDARCGPRHSAKIGASAGDCARLCVHSGASFALVAGDKVYLLEGEPAPLKRVAGERATIVGALSGNTIAVSSVNGGH